MYKPISSVKIPDNKSRNAVYVNPFTSGEFGLDGATVRSVVKREMSTRPSPVGCKLKHLRSLHTVLLRLLLDQPVDAALLATLSATERECLRLFIFKKKMVARPDAALSEALFRKIAENPQPKRIEENLKFIFKKLLRFLTLIFKRHVYPLVSRDLRAEYKSMREPLRSEYAFYGFYFGEVSGKINQKIEKFFYPRSKSNALARNNELVLKTISKLYIKYVGMSPRFVRDMKTYFEHGLVPEIRHSIASKIRRMCRKWESMLKVKGQKGFLSRLETVFKHNNKCKQAWSIQEVQLAARQIVEIIEK